MKRSDRRTGYLECRHGYPRGALPSLARSLPPVFKKMLKEKSYRKMSTKYTAVIHFDGGCSPNPGKKYGSFSICFDDLFLLEKKRVAFGVGTNNEAEFDACHAALKLLKASCLKASVAQKQVRAKLFTDSRIVWNWINAFPSKSTYSDERRQAMYDRAKKCIDLLREFGSFEIEWNPRDVNVEKFGH